MRRETLRGWGFCRKQKGKTRGPRDVLLFLLLLSTVTVNADEFDECRVAGQRYFRNDSQLSIKCHSEYVHYRDKMKSKAPVDETLRVAGYNIYNLGVGQTRFKDIDLTARMLLLWDVIGVVEFRPLPSRDNSHNAALDKLLAKLPSLKKIPEVKVPSKVKESSTKTRKIQVRQDGKKVWVSVPRWEVTQSETVPLSEELILSHYRRPGYVVMLQKLRELDPESGWSLVMGARGLGESSHKEIGGFLYRASKVKVVSNQICQKKLKDKKAIACPVPFSTKVIRDLDGKPIVPAFSERDTVARAPFMASFRSGKFDFTLLATHIRSRESKKAGLFQVVNNYIFNGPDHGLPPGKNGQFADEKKALISRFGEALSTVRFMGKASQGKEKDWILLGDYNLTRSTRGGEKGWPTILSEFTGAEIYLDQHTSLSRNRGLANEFDHFVTHPEFTQECDLKAARRFNFLLPELVRYVGDRPSAIESRSQEVVEEIKALTAVKKKTAQMKKDLRELQNELERLRDEARWITDIEKGVLAEESSRTDAEAKVMMMIDEKLKSSEDRVDDVYLSYASQLKRSGNSLKPAIPEDEILGYVYSFRRRVVNSPSTDTARFMAYETVLSDHLPISMECRTGGSDDD